MGNLWTNEHLSQAVMVNLLLVTKEIKPPLATKQQSRKQQNLVERKLQKIHRRLRKMQLKVAMNLRMTQVSAKSVVPFILTIVMKERRNGLVLTNYDCVGLMWILVM